jgi:hypothetical protein
MKQDPNSRIAWIAANMPLTRAPDDETFWSVLINAWFLCGVIRTRGNASEKFQLDVLRYSDGIIWC